jgi:pSer/pThr/pTyr-binding forkhead associated (FHA) protein
MATLVITSGQLEGRRIEVSHELVIGRENVDVEIDDAELSRRHVAVRPTEGGLEVEDLGSRNGTRVDGTRIDGPTRIRHGAVLTAGMTTFSVDAPQAEAAPAPPAPAGGGETRVHAAEGTVVGEAPRPAREATVAGASPPPRRRQPAPAAASVETTQPFGRYQASTSRRRRKAATRLWLPQVLTYGAVIGTAVGLALYFA